MIGAIKTVTHLLRRAERAVEPFHNIPAKDWNEALEVFFQNRPLHLGSRRPGSWLHPWEVSPFYDARLEAFRFRVNPGFVNGLAPTMRMDAHFAPPEALNPEEDELRVDVPITLDPAQVLKESVWRAIGPDASPVGLSGDGGGENFSVEFEAVPEYFQTIGVGPPPEVSGSVFSGLQTTAAPDDKFRRLLRACEVVLTQPRHAAKLDVTSSNGIDGTFAQVNVIYQAPFSDTPRLDVLTDYSPINPAEETDLLKGGLEDEPWDKLHIATIYAVSPRGAKEGSVPDATWRIYPRHHCFWNLNHTTNNIPNPEPPKPLQFPMFLAGGAGQLFANAVLATVNDNADLAFEYLRAHRLTGRFWTT